MTRTSNEDDLCYILSIVCDLKDKKVDDRKPQEARDKADVTIEAKRQFIANISHEMRMPLAVILGFTDLLLQQNEFSVDEVREGLSAIHRNRVRLLHLIDDLLDLA